MNPSPAAPSTKEFNANLTLQMLRMARYNAEEATKAGNHGEALAWINTERHLLYDARQAGWEPRHKSYTTSTKKESQGGLFSE